MSNEIRIGKEVKIKRSDGRIHSALISAVNHQNRCVIVEWYERGEVKGKEIDWQTIIGLNPSLTLRESYENFTFETPAKHIPSVLPVEEVPASQEMELHPDPAPSSGSVPSQPPAVTTPSHPPPLRRRQTTTVGTSGGDPSVALGANSKAHRSPTSSTSESACTGVPAAPATDISAVPVKDTEKKLREECHMSTQTDWTLLDTAPAAVVELVKPVPVTPEVIETRKPAAVHVSRIPNVSLNRPASAYISPRQQSAAKILSIMAEEPTVSGAGTSEPASSATPASPVMHEAPHPPLSTRRRHHVSAERPFARATEDSNSAHPFGTSDAALSEMHIRRLPSSSCGEEASHLPRGLHVTLDPSDTKSTSSMRPRRCVSPSKHPTVSSLDDTHSVIVGSSNPSQSSPAPPSRRTSRNAGQVRSSRRLSCLQEIEKIQQRREERRAAQKNIRDHHDVDVNNPHWEFLMKIREYQESIHMVPFPSNLPVEVHKINVCVRKRPLSRSELLRKEIDVVTIPNKDTVIVHEPKIKVDLTKYLENQTFRLDYVFDELANNELVYRYTAQPLIHSLIDGGMATCFAYGQTGSGKTHTMSGDFVGKGEQDHTKGIYALAARDLFTLLSTEKLEYDFRVEVSYFEIYSGKVFDLLNNKEKLRMLEDQKGQVNLMGLKSLEVQAVDEVLDLLYVGNSCRTSGQTSANSHSSRSHAVFQLRLMRPKFRGGPPILHGQFSLIDLAGNERGADTRSSDRQTRMEGAEINKSLLALKECIRALGRKAGTHLPFRGSKLTQVLRDSFLGEQSRTCMIAMLSPGFTACENTMNTLRYADRVKELPSSGATSTVAAAPSNIKCEVGEPSPPVPPTVTSSCASETVHGTNIHTEPHAVPTTPNTEHAQVDMDDGLLNDPLAATLERIEALEEEISEEHRQVVELYPGWINQHKKLFKQTNRSDYNVDKYSQDLLVLLDKQMKTLTRLKEKVAVWKAEMKAEEMLSSTMVT